MLLCECVFGMCLSGSLRIHFLAILVVVGERLNRYVLGVLPCMVPLLMCTGGVVPKQATWNEIVELA